MSIGTSLAYWFVYSIVVGFFAGYVAAPVAARHRVSAVFPTGRHDCVRGLTRSRYGRWSIWYRRSWGTTIRSTIDGLAYALLTAGVFGWLWPR